MKVWCQERLAFAAGEHHLIMLYLFQWQPWPGRVDPIRTAAVEELIAETRGWRAEQWAL